MDAVIETARNVWKSDRLIYQPFDDKDAELQAWMLESISNDPVIDAMSAGNLLKPQTKRQALDYVDGLSKCLLAVTICVPVPEEVKTGNDRHERIENSGRNIIGYVGLTGLPPRMAHHRSASILVCIMDGYQDKRYGREAINWIVDWGFRHADLHRISIGAISYNERAIALYQSLGFVFEGRQRDRILFDRKRYDIVDMSMLVSEWEGVRKKEKVKKG